MWLFSPGEASYERAKLSSGCQMIHGLSIFVSTALGFEDNGHPPDKIRQHI